MKTQEAYELAVKGLIRPMGKSPPIITAIRCLQFALPEFQLGRAAARLGYIQVGRIHFLVSDLMHSELVGARYQPAMPAVL